MKQEIDNLTQECLQSCEEMESDYEKVKYISEYLIDTVEYNNIVTISTTTYSSGDVVKVLANNYNNALNNITIIGKVQ